MITHTVQTKKIAQPPYWTPPSGGVCLLDILPPEIFQGIVPYLDRSSICAFLIINKNFTKIVIDAVISTEPDKIRQIVDLVKNSNIFSHFREGEQALQSLVKNQHFSASTNLKELSKKMRRAKDDLLLLLKDKEFMKSVGRLQLVEMRNLAKDLAELQEIDLASQIAKIIPDNYVKHRAFCAIQTNASLSRWWEFEKLKPKVNTFEEPTEVKNVVDLIKNKKNWKGAEELARSIKDLYLQSRALCRITKLYSLSSDCSRAVEIAKTIPDEEEKSLALQRCRWSC